MSVLKSKVKESTWRLEKLRISGAICLPSCLSNWTLLQLHLYWSNLLSPKLANFSCSFNFYKLNNFSLCTNNVKLLYALFFKTFNIWCILCILATNVYSFRISLLDLCFAPNNFFPLLFFVVHFLHFPPTDFILYYVNFFLVKLR